MLHDTRSALKVSALVIIFSALGAAAPPPTTSVAGQCTLDGIKALVPGIPADRSIREVGIDSVKHVPGEAPHCEVIGHVVTQNPGPNKVGWSVLLPDTFAGRYLVQGQGGQGGRILVANNASTRRILAQGIVFSSSDTGASGSEGRWAVESNEAKALDRDHRGAHVSVIATKALARGYYRMPGRRRLYAYHTGCSAGGAMVMGALRNYPRDFDGAVAGTATTGGANWNPYVLQYLLKNPDSWMSPAKLRTLEVAVTKACAGPDGLVRDPKSCGFKPESLQCTGAETDECLTPAQIGLVKRITGPYPVALNRTRAGFTMHMPTGWSSMIGMSKPDPTNVQNPWAPRPPAMAYTISNSVFRSTIVKDASFDLMRDVKFDDPGFWKRLGGGMTDDLSKDPIWAFRRAGGKMLTYSGLGENMAPPLAEIEFLEAFRKLDPKVDDFMRYYPLPGVGHCAGGPGPQDGPDRLLEAMVAWVEQGKAPQSIVARGGAVPGRTTLLCPYPQRATFSGRSGASPMDAANWSCRRAG
jgi:feruloyl esterase